MDDLGDSVKKDCETVEEMVKDFEKISYEGTSKVYKMTDDP